jgi:outer membrane protein assembly factor BamD (BamD/ComL family)
MDGRPYNKAIIAIIYLLLCGLGCSPVGSTADKHPDGVLFARAMDAAERKHFTAAHLTLETLINTYPDSEYADKARLALRDPRIASCGDGWSNPPDCEIAEAAWPN